MKTKKVTPNGLFYIVIVVFLLLNLSLTALTVAMSQQAKSRSVIAQKQRLETQRIVEEFRCILLIHPEDRTTQNVKKCE